MKIARCSDIEVLVSLQRLVLPADKPLDPAAGWWWAAIDGGEAIAFAGMTRSQRWCDAAYLCRAGVAPAHRGRGIQKALIRVRERQARRLGLAWLITDTCRNPASANSLIASGFRLYEPAAPWGLRGALYWRKRLTPKES